MLLDQINLNYLRIFEAVYRTKSMTQAAAELHLTQSGISQHIKSLEDTLGIKLFDRIKQKLVPTEEGKRFFQKLSPQLQNLEELLLELTNRENTLRGQVVVGMPVVFGLNVVIPHLAELAKKHPSLNFKVHFDLPGVLNNLLLRGEIDFAFVDEYNMDRQIETQTIYNENLLLCCTKEYLKIKGEGNTRKYFEGLEYIGYDNEGTLVRRWLDHHYKFHPSELNIRAAAADTMAVAKFVKSHLGAGILPGHHMDTILEQGVNLHIFEGKNTKVLKNKISVAYVKGRSWSKAVQESFKALTESMKGDA